jgi:hypothetical protein
MLPILVLGRGAPGRVFRDETVRPTRIALGLVLYGRSITRHRMISFAGSGRG